MSHIEQENRKNLVLIQDGVIIGTSGFGRSRMTEMSEYGEIISLYLLPNIWERDLADCYCRQMSVN